MDIKDKVVGSWCGMAVGDAMGLSAKSIKPETIQQLFGSMNSFKDVRPFIGKGIKRFKMQGLYGIQTQGSLVIADCLLQNRKWNAEKTIEFLTKLSVGGPEHYLGVYRHPDKKFFQLINSLKGAAPQVTDHNPADATFLTMGIPAGLIHRDRPEIGISVNINIGLMMSRNLCEITGLALIGYLVSRFLLLKPESEEPHHQAEEILITAEEFCQKIQNQVEKTAPIFWNQTSESERGLLKKSLTSLRERWGFDCDELLNWICQNASGRHKIKITSPAQSYVLTLLPLCLLLVLREGREFGSTLTTGLNMGKEADKIGALVGALAGAIYGWHEIPESWRSSLVNIKEILMRGEGLFSGRFPKAAKDLYEMELGLTTKEFDVGRKYFSKTPVNFSRPTPRPKLSWEDGDNKKSIIPEKSDALNWRKFEKDKSRAKKDRRKCLKNDPADY